MNESHHHIFRYFEHLKVQKGWTPKKWINRYPLSDVPSLVISLAHGIQSHVARNSHRSLVVVFRSPPRYSTAFPLKASAFAGVTSWKRMSPVYMVNLESSFRDDEFCKFTHIAPKRNTPRISKRTHFGCLTQLYFQDVKNCVHKLYGCMYSRRLATRSKASPGICHFPGSWKRRWSSTLGWM